MGLAERHGAPLRYFPQDENDGHNAAPLLAARTLAAPAGPHEAAFAIEFEYSAGVAMEAAGVRVLLDTRFDMRPGPKFFEYERRGVPIRMEAGPRDVEAGSLLCAKRSGGDKFPLPLDDDFGHAVKATLDAMQAGAGAQRTH